MFFKESHLPQNGMHLPRCCLSRLGDGGGCSLNHPPEDPWFWSVGNHKMQRPQDLFWAASVRTTNNISRALSIYPQLHTDIYDALKVCQQSPGKGHFSLLHTRKIGLERGGDSPETVALGVEPQGSPSKVPALAVCLRKPRLLQTARSPVYRDSCKC